MGNNGNGGHRRPLIESAWMRLSKHYTPALPSLLPCWRGSLSTQLLGLPCLSFMVLRLLIEPSLS